MGIFSNFFNRSKNINKFNQWSFGWMGTEGSTYDYKAPTYLNEGFNKNPIVYSLISQMATKTSAVPRTIKKIEDKKEKQKLKRLLKATKHNLTPQQQVKKILLESKSYNEDDEFEMPLERPNPLQTWNEFLELYKTFIKLTGNAYLYTMSPSDGVNKSKPLALYWLPSHLVNIVLKDDVSLMSVDESPVSHYLLIEGDASMKFLDSEITHIKYPNPNYDNTGSHLYGVSPVKSMLRNVESSNLALDLNVKTMKNGGAFGLIHSKGQTALTETQAKGLKDRLVEMDRSTDRLAKIAGVSAEIGFTRLSMTTDELKLFEFLQFDKQQIADCLGWEIVSEGRGDYGGTVQQIRKQRVIDNIIPDLELFASAFNSKILPNFKGYEGRELVFDYSELPEMQQDVKLMSEWVIPLRNSALITGNQSLMFLGIPKSDNKLMDELITDKDYLTLEQSLDDMPTITNVNE